MRNVKEVYNLEYLAMPDLVYDTWITSQQLDLNNATLLSNLIQKFRKKGDNTQADRLYSILDKCLDRCQLFDHPETKEAVIKKFREDTQK